MLKKKFFAIALIATGIAAAAFWFIQNPPGVTMINPARPPEPILEPAEVEKIRTLQTTKEVYLLGGISPDDTTIMVMAGIGEDSAQTSWLDIQTGQMESTDSKLMKFVPQGDVAWSSDQTAHYLSNDANGDPVLVTVQRGTGEIKAEVLEISGRVLRLSPDGSRLLIEGGTPAKMELSVRDLKTGKMETLLSYAGGSGPQSIAWTPDGGKLAIVRYEIPAELADDPEKIGEFAMKEALGEIPLEQNLYLSSNVIEIFDPGEGNFQPETLHAADGDGYLFKEVTWSPDGQILLAKTVSLPNPPDGLTRHSWHRARFLAVPPTGSTMPT